MEKDEILKKSREENKNRDFVEEEAVNRANAVAFSVGMMVCGLLSVLHAIFLESVEFSVWVVMWAISASVFLVKYRRLHKRHELIFGLFYGALSIFFFVLYLRRTLGVF